MNEKKKYMLISAIIFLCIGGWFYSISSPSYSHNRIISSYESEIIKLPEPNYNGNISVEKALLIRRSIRDYKDEPLTLEEVSQLLWAAQGITKTDMIDSQYLIHYRTTPSAGALYPLELYIVAGNVINLPEGIYKYKPVEHELIKIAEGDKRIQLSVAALNQACIRNCSAVIVFGAVYKRTTQKYLERGIRYVYMEAGHAAQNVYLQAASLNLGTVVVGGFDDDEVKKVVNMTDDENRPLLNEEPLYLMSVGKVIITEVEKENSFKALPKEFTLSQNFPNPFNASTRITFQLTEALKVQVVVYDIQGREVRRLLDGYVTAGRHSVTWDGRDNAGKNTSSGIYIYRLEAKEKGLVSAKRMILIR